jgi:general secretion pathway protein G
MARTVSRRSRQGGFTLTEMLIVLGILVMLLALVVPRFLGSKKKADKQAALAQVELLRGALERYALDMKDFPTTEQGLDALLSAPSDEGADAGSAAGSWDGPYLSKDAIPLDPWGSEYQYAYPPERGSGEFPDIWSYGPDREDDTDDDICSWAPSGGSRDSDEAGASGKRRKDTDVDIDVKVGKGAKRERNVQPKAPREPRAPRERQP